MFRPFCSRGRVLANGHAAQWADPDVAKERILPLPATPVVFPARKICKRTKGRAMAQAVSRRPLTAEARVRSRVSPCEICGGQSGTGTGFSPSCWFSLANFIPLVLH
jgi:hypothetical protein